MAERNLAPSKIDSFKNFLSKPNIKNQIMGALPKMLNPERFFKSIFIAAFKKPKILECSTESILIAILHCAELGLMPIMGRAHLIPYWNSGKKCYECQFQAGYQGLVDLARRSGEIADVSAHVVYEKDILDFEYGTNEHLSHKPCMDENRGNLIGAYVVWFYKDTSMRPKPDFMPIQDIYKRRDKSPAWQAGQKKDGYKDSPWYEWEDDMARKTVVKWSSKMQPVSEEMMKAIEYDNQLDMGNQSLLDMDFGSQPGELPEGEGFTGAEIDAQFNQMLPEDIDEQILYAFIYKCVNVTNKKSEDKITAQDVKADAIENMEYFLKAFKKFEQEFKAEQEKEKEKESKPKRTRSSSKKSEPKQEEPSNGDIFSKLKADKKLFPDTYRSEAHRLNLPLETEELTLKNAELLHNAINAKTDKQSQCVEY